MPKELVPIAPYTGGGPDGAGASPPASPLQFPRAPESPPDLQSFQLLTCGNRKPFLPLRGLLEGQQAQVLEGMHSSWLVPPSSTCGSLD